jgi:5-formyltetrahydrofolate cyclo-ligase
MVSEASSQKRALRAELRARRRTLSAPQRERAAAGLTDQLRALVTERRIGSLSCYLSSTTEPDTRPFLSWALDHGILVLLPVSRDDGLLDWAVYDGESEAPGIHGLPEAVGELLGPIAVGTVDLMLIPAAAVDLHGMRMGWGRGYFDRILGSMEKCPPVYAVVFDTEVLESVPRERHDEPVDGAVTPTRVLRFR